MKIANTILCISLGVGLSAAAAAADMDSMAPTAFVKKAAQDGMTEVEAGKVALSKSQDPKIRSFAQRMVEDHGKANTELAAIAKSKGIAAPKTLDSEHQAMVKAFRDKSGAEFDAAYAHHMNMDHTKAISLFEGEAKSSDADLAAFAQKTLPTLKEHKELAEKLPHAE